RWVTLMLALGAMAVALTGVAVVAVAAARLVAGMVLRQCGREIALGVALTALILYVATVIEAFAYQIDEPDARSACFALLAVCPAAAWVGAARSGRGRNI